MYVYKGLTFKITFTHKKKEKFATLKKNKDEECYSLQTDEDIAVTLAMAQQYQYFTESDEEVEEGENNEVENTDTTDFDNSAW